MRKVRRLKTRFLQSQHGAKGRNKVLKSRVLKAWKSTIQWTDLKAANRAGEGRKAIGGFFCFFFLSRYSFLIIIFIYLFIFGCVGSSFLYEGFLQLRQAGATLHRGARASHYRGLSCCEAQAPDVQAQ